MNSVTGNIAFGRYQLSWSCHFRHWWYLVTFRADLFVSCRCAWSVKYVLFVSFQLLCMRNRLRYKHKIGKSHGTFLRFWHYLFFIRWHFALSCSQNCQLYTHLPFTHGEHIFIFIGLNRINELDDSKLTSRKDEKNWIQHHLCSHSIEHVHIFRRDCKESIVFFVKIRYFKIFMHHHSDIHPFNRNLRNMFWNICPLFCVLYEIECVVAISQKLLCVLYFPSSMRDFSFDRRHYIVLCVVKWFHDFEYSICDYFSAFFFAKVYTIIRSDESN